MESQGASLEEVGRIGQVASEGATGSRGYVTGAPRAPPRDGMYSQEFFHP